MNERPEAGEKVSTRKERSQLNFFLVGIAFAMLWPSAATASKIALNYGQPFFISICRFFIGGLIMLFISHTVMRNRLPEKHEWKQLAIYGLLNIALYLGLYIVAMQYISPGLGSLAVATNPVFISLINTFILRKPLNSRIVYSLLLCVTGVLIAAWPLFATAHATPGGLLMLLGSMLIYSFGVIYFSEQKWNHMHSLTINGWQTLLGGVMLLPLMFFTWDAEKNQLNWAFAASILWLAVPVSIIAVQLWLSLLRENAVKASFWLFLCPISGFIIARIVVKEPITGFTVSGMLLVLVGLYIVQRARRS